MSSAVSSLRRIPRRCLYCGRRIQGENVCSLHLGVFQADQLGRTARFPLTERERSAAAETTTP